jgi:hypothetical protein
MRARYGGACVALLLLLTACGSGDHARRDSVNAYLQGVNRAQAQLVAGQGQVDLALQSFSLKRMTSPQLGRLRNARGTIAKALERLRALDPPPDARRLDALLAQRLALQLALVDELRQTGRDVPRLAAAVSPLRAAARRLGQALTAISTRQKTVPAGSTQELLDRYGDAFGAYGDALKPLRATLEASGRPSLLEPELAAEQRAVARSVSLCAAIRSALGRGDIEAANRAIAALFSVSQTLNGAGAAAAQRAAARAYDARIRKIDQLAIAITTERNRLVQLVG